MPVTRDEIVSAYRLFLGRDPESEDAIAAKLLVPNRDALRQGFLQSNEFRQTSNLITVGRYARVDRLEVESDATADQRAAMLGFIEEAWTRFGETDPHWSVLTDEAFRADRIAEVKDQFYASGHERIADHLAMLRRNGADPATIKTAIDFGCGVGRLSLAWGEHIPTVLGVDVSAPHVAIARERAEEIGKSGVAFTTVTRLDDLAELPASDLVFSEIVLQHNPPPIIAETLKHLFSLVAPGGYALFQVPTFIDGYSFRIEEYLDADRPQMEMNLLPQQVIFRLAKEANLQPLEIREDTQTGSALMVSHTFLFTRPR